MTARNFIDPKLVKHALENSKGRKMGITVIKKDNSTRVFNFNACSENAPSFQFHKNLVSINEVGQGYKSFDINKVLRIAFDKQVIEATA